MEALDFNTKLMFSEQILIMQSGTPRLEVRRVVVIDL
jgi:hypothetical protein